MTSRVNGWTTVAFGDVVRKLSDRVDPETSGLERYVAGEHMDTDDLRIRRWGMIGDGYLGPAFHMRFKPGQVLYGSRRTYLRKVAVPDFEGVTANTTFVLETKDPAVLLPELLPYVMSTESFHRYSIEQSKGSVNPYINFSDLADYEFALPPLHEQVRIVNAATAIESCREKLLGALDELEIVTRARLQLSDVDERVPLKQVVGLVTKGTTPTTIDHDYVGRGIPFLRAEDVSNAVIDLSTCERFIDRLTHKELSRSQIKGGDVLVTIAGTIGRVGLVADGAAEANCNQAVAIIRPRDSMYSRFLAAWLQSADAQVQMRGGQVTGTISNLSLTRIKGIRLPVLDESRLETYLSSHEHLMWARESIDQRRDRLRQLLRNAVAGVANG